MNDLISVDRAIEILDAQVITPRTESVRLDDALSRRLAEDILADRDYPPFDKSVMDGFAVRAADVVNIPASLRVIETIAAGASASRKIEPSEAAAIMTGAPVPDGADSVIPVEFTSRDGNCVNIQKAIKPGQAIARRGSDTTAGRVVLKSGTRIGPVHIAVAASVGKTSLKVFKKPDVSILSTGDELIDIDKTPVGSQIRNSNSHMLLALLQRMGCEIKNVAIVHDDPAKIREAISHGLLTDALFITGGMSMGERDYVPEIFRGLELELKITKLRMKPGKPFVFATKKDAERTAFAFGLPGNPVSAYVCAVRLAGRILSRMSGGSPDENITQAILAASMPANGPREFYVPAIKISDGVRPLDWNGSADIYTFAHADCLIIRRDNATEAHANDVVQILDLAAI